MDARRRAAKVAADVERSRAVASATRGVTLYELGVYVKDGEVWSQGGWRPTRLLGPLKGACAGVMDLKPSSDAAFITTAVLGLNSPRVGTIFVAFEDGSRHERPLRQGTPSEMHKVDVAIRRFNTMADAAGAAPN